MRRYRRVCGRVSGQAENGFQYVGNNVSYRFAADARQTASTGYLYRHILYWGPVVIYLACLWGPHGNNEHGPVDRFPNFIAVVQSE